MRRIEDVVNELINIEAADHCMESTREQLDERDRILEYISIISNEARAKIFAALDEELKKNKLIVDTLDEYSATTQVFNARVKCFAIRSAKNSYYHYVTDKYINEICKIRNNKYNFLENAQCFRKRLKSLSAEDRQKILEKNRDEAGIRLYFDEHNKGYNLALERSQAGRILDKTLTEIEEEIKAAEQEYDEAEQEYDEIEQEYDEIEQAPEM